MQIPIYQVDAFANELFCGNPAAVCMLQEWIADDLMQAIALENNLSETAFLAPSSQADTEYEIRWFTPAIEVNLCGHATLASGHVVLRLLRPQLDQVSFSSHSGNLTVTRQGENLQLDFPAVEVSPCAAPDGLMAGLGLATAEAEVYRADEDYLIRIADEPMLQQLKPDFAAVAQVAARGIIVTAPGLQKDFVSRFFAPQSGVNEDPVTGSAHCALMPYWARELGRNTLSARQISKRAGDIQCEWINERVLLAGQSRHYLSGFLHLD